MPLNETDNRGLVGMRWNEQTADTKYDCRAKNS